MLPDVSLIKGSVKSNSLQKNMLNLCLIREASVLSDLFKVCPGESLFANIGISFSEAVIL
jgi:hypothetical protein